MSTTASSDEESDQFDVEQLARPSLSTKPRRRTLNQSEEDEPDNPQAAAPPRRTSRRLTIQVNSNPALEIPTQLSQMKGKRPASTADSDDDLGVGPSTRGRHGQLGVLLSFSI